MDLLYRLAATGMALLLFSSQVMANDTVANFAAGGLVAQRTTAIRMNSEALWVSPDFIEVNYEFENLTKSDVTTSVAFPMPDVYMAHLYHSPAMLPNEGKPNFLNFRVWAGGQEVVPTVEVRAFLLDGKEVTAPLNELGVDIMKGDIGDERTTAALIALGAATEEFAEWVARVNFHWSQTFPAGQKVRIRHTYQPSLGGRLLSTGEAEWCMDAAFDAGLGKMADEKRAIDHLSHGVWGHWVQYVLKTGANWAGPIGKFTLTIDKADRRLVSTCPIPGLRLRKKGNGFTASAKNYTPTADLNILFTAPPGW